MILQRSLYFLAAGCGALNSLLSKLMISKSGKDIGPSWTWLAKAVTFGQCRYKVSNVLHQSMERHSGPGVPGRQPSRVAGAKEFPRMSSGMLFEGAQSGCNWIILLRMIYAGPAQNSAM